MYLRRPVFTHERFAFFFISAYILFLAVNIVPIFAGDSLLFLILKGLYKFFGLDIEYSSNIFDKIVSLLLAAWCAFVGLRLHAQMAGPITDRKHISIRQGRETGFVSDALAECVALKNSQPLPLAKNDEDQPIAFKFDPNTGVDWKSRAFRLLSAYTNQYNINFEIDWLQDLDAFFCTYGLNNISAIVYCPRKTPCSEDFSRLASECKNQGINPQKFVIICESDSFEVEDIDLNTLPRPEILTEEFLLNRIANFDTYKRYVINKFEVEQLSQFSGLTLEKTFSQVSATGVNGSIDDLEAYIESWSSENSPKHVAILGEYGQGKSTFVSKIAYNFFKFSRGTRIPIIIELRGRNPRNEELEQLFFPWCKKFGVTPDALLALHAAGRLIVILDGFDEMDSVGDAEVRISHINKIWQLAAFPNAKVLLTGRPNFFFDTSEMKRALLQREELGERPYCEALRLLPLDQNRAEHAIRHFPPAIVNSITKALRSKNTNRSLSELLLRPSTLIWAATVWQTLDSEGSGAPILSASVLRRFINQANQRQMVKGLKTALLASERQFLTTAVALDIHNRAPGTNQISTRQLQGVIDTCLDHLPDILREVLEPGEAGKLPATDRFQSRTRFLEAVVTEIRASGIIVEDLSKPNTLRFAHKSFYEYLVGEYKAVSRSHGLKNACRYFGIQIEARETHYKALEFGISGIINSGLSITNKSLLFGEEVDLFAGETLVNMCFENMHPSKIEKMNEVKNRKAILDATKIVWLGPYSNVIPVRIYDEKEQEIQYNYGPSLLLAYAEEQKNSIFFSKALRIVINLRTTLGMAMIAPRLSNLRAWVYGARALGFIVKPAAGSSQLIRNMYDV